MTIITPFITEICRTEKYIEKSKLLHLMLGGLSNRKIKLSSAEKEEFSNFIFGEIESLILLIPATQTYKEKDFLFNYATHLQQAMITCHPSSDELTESNRKNAEILFTLIQKEKFLENMLGDIFIKKMNDPENVKYMLAMTDLAKEEYHKGKFYQGLLHYQRSLLKLPEESRELIGAHIQSEMTRYLENPLTPDIEANLELICDVCRYFGKDRFAELLKKALWVGNHHIRFYAVATMLVFNCEIPAGILKNLATDMEYANLTYSLLKQCRREKLFPPECATPEYLAQSSLVRWLTYPNELGKAPDEIEYIGKVRKGGIFYVFRFRSDSKNLDEETQGEWLIAWTGPRGGTFSNFDVYNDYAQETTDKTLKYIKQKLL